MSGVKEFQKAFGMNVRNAKKVARITRGGKRKQRK